MAVIPTSPTIVGDSFAREMEFNFYVFPDSGALKNMGPFVRVELHLSKLGCMRPKLAGTSK
ncbi:hypothetical protein PIB30_065756, partial [Stylosanthes scabra]|nr:hypothetical protein [Stylosanthes scabra]